MDHTNTQYIPKVAYFEPDRDMATTISHILTGLGLQVDFIDEFNSIKPHLEKNPDTRAVILRNQTYDPDGNTGLSIAPELSKVEGFSGPIIVLTGNLYRGMKDQIPEEHRKTAKIQVVESCMEEGYASFLYIAIRSKFPHMTGFTRENFYNALGFEIDERTDRIKGDYKLLLDETREIVYQIIDKNGSTEAYNEILEKIVQWQQSKEGGQDPDLTRRK